MRLAVSDVTPLELWDAPVRGRRLQDWRNDPCFGERLASVVAGPLVGDVAGVHLLGGGAGPALAGALRRHGRTVIVDPDPVFAAVRAGRGLVSPAADACVDVGQTSIKVDGRDGTRRIARPAELAHADAVADEARDAARRRTVELVATALIEGGVRTCAVLALPAQIDAEGTPSGCSYPWHDPDPMLVPDIARRAGLVSDALFVLNDAELAAAAVRTSGRWRSTGSVLVLTIGFGVGAARLEAR